ncbi:MAG: hypothetical protein ACRDJH_09630 [Thermomicrobiales bacterium]
MTQTTVKAVPDGFHTITPHITDPFGHRWGLAQRLHDVPPEEIARAAAQAFGG